MEKIKYKEIFDPTLFKTDTILHKSQDVRILTINIFILFTICYTWKCISSQLLIIQKLMNTPQKIIDPAKFLFF